MGRAASRVASDAGRRTVRGDVDAAGRGAWPLCRLDRAAGPGYQRLTARPRVRAAHAQGGLSMAKAITPKGFGAPLGMYSHGMIAPGGELVVVAGQVGMAADGQVAADDVIAQTKQALENVRAVARRATRKPAPRRRR